MDVDEVVHFRTQIYQIGQNRCVDVPDDIELGGGTDPIPVVLTVGRKSVRTNLLPRGGGRFRVFVDSDLREAASADTGDRIDVEFRLDATEREPEIPAELRQAIEASEWASGVFSRLTVNQRCEMARFVDDAKHETTRLRRVARVLEVLGEMDQKGR